MNKRQAYLMGKETGNEITRMDFNGFINDEFKEKFKEELTAKEFNESQEPDEIWEEYERGVWDSVKKRPRSK